MSASHMNSNSSDQAQSATQKPPRRRNGKIARLPEQLRDAVNAILRDATPYDVIIAKLREHGIKVGRSNITRWKNGGYQDYRQERLWLKEMQANLDFILDHLRNSEPDQIPEAAVQLSSIRLFQFLRDFSQAAGNGGPNANSTDFIRAANAACRLSQTTLALKSLKSCVSQSNQVSA
jgi:uncharacterized protein DUF3486